MLGIAADKGQFSVKMNRCWWSNTENQIWKIIIIKSYIWRNESAQICTVLIFSKFSNDFRSVVTKQNHVEKKRAQTCYNNNNGNNSTIILDKSASKSMEKKKKRQTKRNACVKNFSKENNLHMDKPKNRST